MKSRLRKRIESLRGELASAAQKVIDQWSQDKNGIDEELGSGGACDMVSAAMSEILGSIDEVQITDGGMEGDDHAFPIVFNDEEAFAVDIPPGVYEIGSGYSWKKIEGALIRDSDVEVYEVDRDLISDW